MIITSLVISLITNIVVFQQYNPLQLIQGKYHPFLTLRYGSEEILW